MGKYISFKPKLAARKLRQKAEQEARERRDAEDRGIMGKRAEAEAKRKADKEARRLEIKVAMEAALAETEARAQARAETIRAIPWLKSYTNGELDTELTRRRQWPPTSVEVGIGYWQEVTVDELLEELAATPLDANSSKWIVDMNLPRIVHAVDQLGQEREMRFPPLNRPCSWAVRAWREWELALALRQREKDPNAIFRRVIQTMEWTEFYAQQGHHQNNPAARH